MTTLTFWVDVDNTLINNDGIKEDFNSALLTELGPELTARFWDFYEQVRRERDVVDIPLALTRFREQIPLSVMDEQKYRHIRSIFENYPFYQALYPNALETLRSLRELGTVVIVSDGDLYFQAEKIFASALAEAVDGRVLLYIHKQEHLDEIMKRYPADHYVMIDDKPKILFDTKAALDGLLTSAFVKQGKYAAGPLPDHFLPDIMVEHIGDLRTYTKEQFLQTRS